MKVAPVLERVGDFTQFLGEPCKEDVAYAPIRRAETIGRSIGDADWLKALEKKTGRVLVAQKSCSCGTKEGSESGKIGIK